LTKKILVPIDGSKNANKALDYALKLAKTCESEVELFNVVEPVRIPVAPYTYYGAAASTVPAWINSYTVNFKAGHKTMLSDTLKKAKKDFPNLEISKKMVDGRPATEITKRAKEGKFDLIVLGNRGLSGLEEFFLGSVSDNVADEAECPVLIVK
jgi:nucleotide-binding universal stress UspA family protein